MPPQFHFRYRSQYQSRANSFFKFASVENPSFSAGSSMPSNFLRMTYVFPVQATILPFPVVCCCRHSLKTHLRNHRSWKSPDLPLEFRSCLSTHSSKDIKISSFGCQIDFWVVRQPLGRNLLSLLWSKTLHLTAAGITVQAIKLCQSTSALNFVSFKIGLNCACFDVMRRPNDNFRRDDRQPDCCNLCPFHIQFREDHKMAQSNS